MPLRTFLNSIDELKPLLHLIEVSSQNQATLTSAGFSPQLIPPATSGAIVLMVGRFEHFVKEIGGRAFDYYAEATPPIRRTQLDVDVQAMMLFQNLSAAGQKKRHGVLRNSQDRVRDMDAASNKVVQGYVWGDDVVQTYSNPSSETVREALALVGVDKPWRKIDSAFHREWRKRQRADSSLKQIPSPQVELDSILGWRNSAAHSRGSLPIGAQELKEAVEFFGALGVAIDHVLKTHVMAHVKSLQSAPAPWA